MRRFVSMFDEIGITPRNPRSVCDCKGVAILEGQVLAIGERDGIPDLSVTAKELPSRNTRGEHVLPELEGQVLSIGEILLDGTPDLSVTAKELPSWRAKSSPSGREMEFPICL
uniref:Uncharacterized protein n=1 Tax=Chromera velia CCMP2878 TaxID=1169474 RepID=A0A0G4FJE4_9ALVE|eukprot:Cvel_17293.t1-p1 / transcript=Cvel_17293.t1 / gene=Cvel_17293 / organism=Chromera_velia_CCMP2878 / gene_product=hypothetical protein / transcript_product=hypothetical protein / location=Cvel_scaffold1372:32624-45118(-) / protein_length=112 / sequence_SO=supercontig / SO=protein_coding / is_pseudo=false